MRNLSHAELRAAATIAKTLVQMRLRAKLTQAQVAARMKTTQTAIARLEAGRQSPSLSTLMSYAKANGYCLEIGFVGPTYDAENGCIVLIQNGSSPLTYNDEQSTGGADREIKDVPPE